MADRQPRRRADRELLVAPTLPVGELLSVPAFARVGRAVVVGADATVAGIISVTDLDRMRTLRSLQPAPAVRVPSRPVAAELLRQGRTRDVIAVSVRELLDLERGLRDAIGRSLDLVVRDDGLTVAVLLASL